MIIIYRAVAAGVVIAVDALAVTQVTVTAGANSGVFAVPPGRLSIPAGFVDQTANPAALKPWATIQAEILRLRPTDPIGAASAASARDQMLAKLLDLEIDLLAAGGGFLGVQRLSLSAQAQARARLSINLLNMADSAAADAVVLSAQLTGSVDATVNPQHRTIAGRIEVTVTKAGVIAALPSFSVEPLPQLPALDLRWPAIPWPDIRWANLDLSGLRRLLRLDLPIGGATPVIEVRLPGLQMRAQLAAGVLSLGTTVPANGGVFLNRSTGSAQIAAINGFAFSLDSAGNLAVAGTIDQVQETFLGLDRRLIEDPRALPVSVEIAPATLTLRSSAQINLAMTVAAVTLSADLVLPRIVIRSKKDPTLLLALSATYRVEVALATGMVSGRLTELHVVEPYPIELLAQAGLAALDAAQAAADALAGIIRLIGGIRLPAAPTPEIRGLLDRIAAMLRAAAEWIAEVGSDLVGGLLGVAGDLVDLLASLARKLSALWPSGAPTTPHLIVELQLDGRTLRPRRIVISPASSAAEPVQATTLSGAGLELTLPASAGLAMLVDLDGPASLALIARVPAGASVSLATDLWLDGVAGPEAMRDTDEHGDRPAKRLITVTATAAADPQGRDSAIALARWSAGQASFFQQAIEPSGGPGLTWSTPGAAPHNLTVGLVSGALRYADLGAWVTFDVTTNLDVARRLPFLRSGPSAGTGPFGDLAQYIEISRNGLVARQGGKIGIPLLATLKIANDTFPLPVVLELDPHALSATFTGGSSVPIQGSAAKRSFDVFGLQGDLFGAPVANANPAAYAYLTLTLSGSPGLSLAPGARLVLHYGKIAADGRGVAFNVTELRASAAGLDLEAEVDPSKPVTLAGVGMPFRFRHGALSIKRSHFQAFSIAGSGQLPPELVGEANASIAISLGCGPGGDLIVQSAEAKLDKAGDPLVCHGTWFDLTLSALGFEFHDFSDHGAGYHFYFTLTGTAEFRPRSSDAVQGLLKNLAGVKIILDKAPLARDASMLARAISFQVPMHPPKRFNLFNLFSFELRGIGFHPSSPAFDGKPAIALSGQINFVEAGDSVSARFDFHMLWIAPPKSGDWVPQVRCDGLTVGIRLGGQASIEGTAITVDDQMPSLFRPGVLPGGYTARGFLASGKLSIQGWASMGAAMGFLEISDGKSAPRLAFFVAADLRELSYEIPTPIGEIYLRQVGFGFGFRYTIAAFNAADQVQSVTELIKALDEISRYQGNLASITAWEPEARGDRVTLALSGVISLATASTETSYNKSGEKELSNPVLFDVVAALRSDLTFFLAARVWLCFNYEDYNSAGPEATWLKNPTLRGYTYLSVPRQEFLARLIADGRGEIGTHPQLPSALTDAMKSVRWSATTYIRPGLFHQEFGWPYELQYSLGDGKSLSIQTSGGLIQRIEDGAMLFGIAFKAVGWAQVGGSVGGRSFGASVAARADFSLDAKLIAYISVARRDDTLFYGSLAFEASIRLEVHVWLEIDLTFTTVHLDVGFSESLTLSLALEVAATPSELAFRGSASVGVSGFGRSLRLGIGVEYQPGELVKARSRVERFLTLGLTVTTPDPARALEPPALTPPRERTAAQADRTLEQQVAKHADSKAPATAPTPAKGDPLRPAAWWAMLFPTTPDGQGARYILTFIPRDRTETGDLCEEVLPTHLPDGPFGGFYPPPAADAANPALTVTAVGGTDVTVLALSAAGGSANLRLFGNVPIPYQNDFRVAVEGDKVLDLKTLVAAGYIVTGPSAAPVYYEPRTATTKADRTRLPDDREEAAQTLLEAGRDVLDLEVEHRKAVELEERRSAAIASLADSAMRLAAVGESGWARGAAGGLDARALGLAFVITQAQVDLLFDLPPDGPNGVLPRAARLRLWPAGVAPPVNADLRNVHLFNPPERMFQRMPPRFAGAEASITPTGVRLSWDLEPPFGGSRGIWDDPEFRLKHYRIEREITAISELVSLWDIYAVTTKPATPAALVRDPVSGRLVWRLIHPDAQFVDDLADLTPQARTAILRPAEAGPAPANATGLLKHIYDGKGDVALRYRVTPVDINGEDGQPHYLTLAVGAPKPVRPALRQAIIEMAYPGDNPIRRPEATPATPVITLTVDDPATVVGQEHPPALTYTLRIRPERTSPTGLFGADAVADARVRPTAGDFSLQRADDEPLFTVTLAAAPDDDNRRQVTLDAVSLGSAAELTRLLRALGITTPAGERIALGPRAVRIAIRGAAPKDDPLAWTIAEIALSYPAAAPAPAPSGAVAPAKPAPVREPLRFPVEVFEHPLRVEPAPLLREDLSAESGQVMLLYPPASGQSSDFRKGRAQRLRDPARRVGTKVRWRPRPTAKDDVAGSLSASDLQHYVGGFNLFEVDAAGEVEAAPTTPGAADLHMTFAASGAPASGRVTLSGGASQATAIEINISVTDADGADTSALVDGLVALPLGGSRIALASQGGFLDFVVLGRRSSDTARTLVVQNLQKSGANPFSAGDAVRLVYRGPFGARNVARVLALPSSLIRLDPSEIADFAKVEARYPSDTRRVTASGAQRNAATRLAPWYSPAESYVVWPTRFVQRSLGLSVDEHALTALVMAGRSNRVEASVQVKDASFKTRLHLATFPFADRLGAAQDGVFTTADGAPSWSTPELRSLFQALLLDDDPALETLLANQDEALHNATVKVISRDALGGVLGEVSWPIDLDPRLHPVIGDVLDWARYEAAPDTAPLRVFGTVTLPDLGDLSQAARLELRLAGWPAAENLPTPRLLLERDGEIQSDPALVPRDRRTSQVHALLESALVSLCLDLDEDRRRVARALAKDHSEQYAATAVEIWARDAQGAEARLIALPVVAETLARAPAATLYRRYEPVMEPPPRSDARDVASWMDETPVGRDPYGWSVLRRLGLASGVRLFDTELAEYVKPAEAIKRLEDAFAWITPRYAAHGDVAAELGAGFLELIARPGGATSLASFDGAAPAISETEIEHWLDTEALALVQVSLRPAPRPMTGSDGSAPIAYYCIVANGPGEVVLHLDGAAAGTVMDVVDLTTDLAASPIVTLAWPDVTLAAAAVAPAPAGPQATKPAESAETRQRRELAGPDAPVKLTLTAARIDQEVALVRLTLIDGRQDDVVGYVSGGRPQRVAAPLDGQTLAEPFGRFPEMTADRFGALAADFEARVGDTYSGRLVGNNQVRSALATFRSYARRLFKAGWPEAKDEPAIWARLPQWTRRFLEHGATVRGLGPFVAIAEVTRPEPWRVGVDAEDGTVDVLLTHDDRRRRLKRYMVEPFGRYEPISEALLGTPLQAAAQQPRDYVQSFLQTGLRRDWSRRFIDVVLPRTEPVAPPTLLAARRIVAPDMAGPRRTLEFLYARHNEEMLSEANVTVEGALSFESVNVGFWREFIYRSWSSGLDASIDPLAPFGDGAAPEPPKLIAAPDAFGGLARTPQDTRRTPIAAGRYKDGWRGVTAIRTDAMPWFFKVHAVAFAAAGVVVSDPVIGSVPEGHHDLALPWLPPHEQPAMPATPGPGWRAVRSGRGVSIIFEVPLARFSDSMPLEQRQAWLTNANLPAVFTLPNPDVRWEIRMVGSEPSGATTISPELEMSASIKGSSTFEVKATGARFLASAPPPHLQRQATSGAPDWWQAPWEAPLPGDPYGPDPVFAPTLPDPSAQRLAAFELLRAFASADGIWPQIAPSTAAELSIAPPANTPAGWAQRQTDAHDWGVLYQACIPGSPAAAQAFAFLDGLATAADPAGWWQAHQGGAGANLVAVHLSLPAFASGLPHFPAGRPATITVAMPTTAVWAWPASPRLSTDLRHAARSLDPADDPQQPNWRFVTDVLPALMREMRRVIVMRKARETGAQHVWTVGTGAKRTISSRQTPLGSDLGPAAIDSARARSGGQRIAPDVLDVVVRRSLTGALAQVPELLTLARALEAAPFTADGLGAVIDLLDVLLSGLAHAATQLDLPASAMLDAGVSAAIAGLSMQPGPETATSLLLRAPPDFDESAKISSSLGGVPEALRVPLGALIARAMADQVFGVRQRPWIRATHGAAEPLTDVIVLRPDPQMLLVET